MLINQAFFLSSHLTLETFTPLCHRRPRLQRLGSKYGCTDLLTPRTHLSSSGKGGLFPQHYRSAGASFIHGGLQGPLQICASDTELPCARGRATSCPSLSIPILSILGIAPFASFLPPAESYQGKMIFPNTVSKMLSAHRTTENQLPSAFLPAWLLSHLQGDSVGVRCKRAGTTAQQSGLGNTSFARLYLSRCHCRLQFSTGVALSLSPSTSLLGRSLLNLPWDTLVVFNVP